MAWSFFPIAIPDSFLRFVVAATTTSDNGVRSPTSAILPAGVLPANPPCETSVVVDELPLFDALLNCFLFRRMSRPEFHQIGQLRSFDLAVQMRRTRRNRPKLDERGHQSTLYAFRKEFRAAIRLDTLDGKWHLFGNTIQEEQGVARVSPRMDTRIRKREQSSTAVY